MDDILPCPLCQKEAVIKLDGYTSGDWLVRCTGCGLKSTDYGDEDEAIIAWNKLANMPQKIKRLRKGIQKAIDNMHSTYISRDLRILLKENEDE